MKGKAKKFHDPTFPYDPLLSNGVSQLHGEFSCTYEKVLMYKNMQTARNARR